MATSPTLERYEAALVDIRRSPTDHGLVEQIVVRPTTNTRAPRTACEVSPERGVHGDRWADGSRITLPDGAPHPDVQVALMNSRVIAVLAGSPDRWPLAGDNLYVDLDLGVDNLPVGTRLTVGTATLEITGQPHTGCRKFANRYGWDAVRFVNSKLGRALRLRGVYARVVRAGQIRNGDRIEKAADA